MASSPYARKGVLWDLHRRHYGADGDPLILVARGASRIFNPTLQQRVVDRALARDHAAAAAEYLAQFRSRRYERTCAGREVSSAMPK